jgi:deazaflavin-dependent oxidoreductase (nitroreductase family)
MVHAASRSHPGLTLKRRLLDRVYRQHLNPLVLELAGRRWSPWASLRHVGRRSGRQYTTPVLTAMGPDGAVIPLPFGPDTDWCRNLLAVDGCTLRWQGRDFALQAPRVIGVSGPLRLVLKEYVRAQHAPPSAFKSEPGEPTS